MPFCLGPKRIPFSDGQFFKGVVWEESDMDVVIQDGSGVEAFGAYLLNAEGYELLDTSQGGEYEDSDLKEASSCKLIRSLAY